MKRIYLLTFIITYFSITTFANNNDTIINARINYIESGLRHLQIRNDSLNKELYYYRSKEDLYLGLFERQAGHVDNIFGWLLAIIGLMVPIVAYFSLKEFKSDIVIENRRFIEDIDNLKSQLVKAQIETSIASSSIFMALIGVWVKEGDKYLEPIHDALWEMVSSIHKIHTLSNGNLDVIKDKGLVEFQLKDMLEVLYGILIEAKTKRKEVFKDLALDDKTKLLTELSFYEDQSIKDISIKLHSFILRNASKKEGTN